MSARHLSRFVSSRKKAFARQFLEQDRIGQLGRCHIARCSHEISSHRRPKHSVLFIEIRRNRANLWPDDALEAGLATHPQQPRSQGLQPRLDFLFFRLSRSALRSRKKLLEAGALDEAQIELREKRQRFASKQIKRRMRGVYRFMVEAASTKVRSQWFPIIANASRFLEGKLPNLIPSLPFPYRRIPD